MPVDPVSDLLAKTGKSPVSRLQATVADIDRRLKQLERGSFTNAQYAEALGTITSSVGSPSDTLADGPVIEVNIDSPGRFINILAEAEIAAPGGAVAAIVQLHDSIDFPNNPDVLFNNTSTSFTRMRSAPTGVQGTTALAAQMRSYPASVGTHVLQLGYASQVNGNTSSFRNRKLWVSVT